MLTIIGAPEAAEQAPEIASAAAAETISSDAPPRRPRPVGFWEAAVLGGGTLRLAGWALDAANHLPPAEYVFRWGKSVFQFRDLVVRADVAKAQGCEPLVCGLRSQIAFSKEAFPSGEGIGAPSLSAVWPDGTELVLNTLNSKSDGQFFWTELGIPDPAAPAKPEPDSDPSVESHFPEPAERDGKRRYEGFWEQATFTAKGVTLAAWALETEGNSAPVAYEFRWGNGVARVTELIERPDVARARKTELAPCGLAVEIPFALQDIPQDAHTQLPSLVAIWPDATETVLRPSDRPDAIQFRYMGFETREEFTKYFQNPAFRIRNTAVVAWAAKRALTMFGNDIDLFMGALCVMIYRHLENGFFSATEIMSLSETWARLEATIPRPLRGERLRWVISVKLALGYFFMVRKNFAVASKNFIDITLLDENLASWPQASTNILIGVFMAAWFEYRAGDTATAIVRLGKAYNVFKNGVTYLPVWSKHHFSELDNSLRIAGECFGFQKLLEGETREHILPLTTRLTFVKISTVLRDMIARGQIEDGPFPQRGSET